MNLEDRIYRRLKTELDGPVTTKRAIARIAALEAEDSANPIAVTAVVRPALGLGEPDMAAFQAVFDDVDHD